MPGPPKAATALRRVPSSLSKMSTPPVTLSTQSSKSSKKIKIVKLKVSKEYLSTISEKVSATKIGELKVKASPKTSTKPLPSNATIPGAINSENESKSSAKVVEEDDVQSPNKSTSEGSKKDAKPGEKREAGAGVEEDCKTKPKAPQRKRPKV